MTPSQYKPSGNFQYRQAQPQDFKPKEFQPRVCYNCRQPEHYAKKCANPKRIKTEQQTPNLGIAKGNRDKQPIIQAKQGQLNFTGNLSIREHAFIPFALMMGLTAFPHLLVALRAKPGNLGEQR
jgi:hypothetical protein